MSNVKAFLNHVNDKFYLCTNEGGVFDFKVQTLDDISFERGKFTFSDFYTTEKGKFNIFLIFSIYIGIVIKEIDLYESSLVLYCKFEGLPFIRVINLENPKIVNDINIGKDKGLIGQITPGLNEHYRGESFRFHVDTPFKYN